MNHKFTLYCVPGRLFRPGRHYLVLDEWLTDSRFLILSHGIMSEDEYRNIYSKDHIPIFQCVSYSWIGLYNYHESKKYVETQFTGWLHRTQKYKEWSGIIHVG